MREFADDQKAAEDRSGFKSAGRVAFAADPVQRVPVRRVMRGHHILAALLLVVTRPVFAAYPAQTSAACAGRIRTLEATLREGDERAPYTTPFVTVEGLQPPKARDGEWGNVVTGTLAWGLTERRFGFQPMPVAIDELLVAMGKEIEAKDAQRRMLSPGKPLPRMLLGIWLDSRLRARDVLPQVQALAKKYEVALLAREELPKPRVYPPSVVERMDRIRAIADFQKKFQLVGETFRVALGDCRAPAEAKGRDAVPQALRSCNCVGADLDLIEALVASGNEPRVYLRRLRLQPRAKHTLVLAEEATVQDLVDQLPHGAPNVAVRWKR